MGNIETIARPISIRVKHMRTMFLAMLVSMSLVTGCTTSNSSDVATAHTQNEAQLQNAQTSTEPETKPSSTNSIGFIDETDLKLSQLFLEMSYSELVAIMGKETKKSDIRDLGDDGTEYDLVFNDGTRVTMINDESYLIETTSNKYLTPRGLRVGDTQGKVVELYHYPAYQNDEEWNYTTDNDYILFTVQFEGNKVSKLVINLVM